MQHRYIAGIWVQAYTVKANKEAIGSDHRQLLMKWIGYIEYNITKM